MSDRRLESIDIFRGVSILLVVLYHYTARLPAEALNMRGAPPVPVEIGWIGVYFFFVISGYCIYLTMERAKSVAQFLARRISRIYPAFLVALVLLFVMQSVVPLPSVPAAAYRVTAPGLVDVALNAVFLGEMGEWVNGSFWSIAAEVKFYVLIGVLALVIRDRGRLAVVFTALGAAGAPIWGAALLLQADNGAMSAQSLLKFLTIAPYLSFFAVGILARLRATGAEWTRPYLAISTGASLLVIWLTQFDNGLRADFVAPSVVAAIFAVLLAAFLRYSGSRSLPHMPVLARVGLISYSWYLLHEPMGYALLLQLDPVLPAYVALGVTMVATFLLSWGFAALFEWRFRKPVEALALRVLEWPWPGKRAVAGI